MSCRIASNPGRGPRHLDHQVWARDPRPQPLRLGNGRFGVVREMRRDFEAHVAVTPDGRLVDAAQQIGCMLYILDGKSLVDILHAPPLMRELDDRAVVVVVLGDGLFRKSPGSK